MLGAADDQHLFGRYVQAALAQVAGHRSPLVQPPGVGLITQQRLQVAGQCKLTQRLAQQVSLTRQ
ncbi:hypothetical protein D3C76_1453620 [compost metagenome]